MTAPIISGFNESAYVNNRLFREKIEDLMLEYLIIYSDPMSISLSDVQTLLHTLEGLGLEINIQINEFRQNREATFLIHSTPVESKTLLREFPTFFPTR